jgi:hypothetical protein
VSWERHSDGGDPIWGERTVHVEHRLRSQVIATGTLACPRCDAPVSPPGRGLSLTEPLLCPFCLFDGIARDFLSLAVPTRPARVEVRITNAGALRLRRP